MILLAPLIKPDMKLMKQREESQQATINLFQSQYVLYTLLIYINQNQNKYILIITDFKLTQLRNWSITNRLMINNFKYLA